MVREYAQESFPQSRSSRQVERFLDAPTKRRLWSDFCDASPGGSQSSNTRRVGICTHPHQRFKSLVRAVGVMHVFASSMLF